MALFRKRTSKAGKRVVGSPAKEESSDPSDPCRDVPSEYSKFKPARSDTPRSKPQTPSKFSSLTKPVPSDIDSPKSLVKAVERTQEKTDKTEKTVEKTQEKTQEKTIEKTVERTVEEKSTHEKKDDGRRKKRSSAIEPRKRA